VDTRELPFSREPRQIPADGHLRHREALRQVHDFDALAGADGVQDQPSSLHWKHLCALVRSDPTLFGNVRKCDIASPLVEA
jgi:hypothetical protein